MPVSVFSGPALLGITSNLRYVIFWRRTGRESVVTTIGLGRRGCAATAMAQHSNIPLCNCGTQKIARRASASDFGRRAACSSSLCFQVSLLDLHLEAQSVSS